MRGHGIMQELDRHEVNGFQSAVGAVTKRHFEARHASRSCRSSCTGRSARCSPAARARCTSRCRWTSRPRRPTSTLHDLARRLPVGRLYPDPDAIERAAEFCHGAAAGDRDRRRRHLRRRGCASSGRWPRRCRRRSSPPGRARVGSRRTTACLPGRSGRPGPRSATRIAADADVVVSVGCRFTDWSASSYRKGISFSLPPGKLIQIDIDPQEIGKNYPAEVGILADAKPALAASGAARSRRATQPPAPSIWPSLDALKASGPQHVAARTDSHRIPVHVAAAAARPATGDGPRRVRGRRLRQPAGRGQAVLRRLRAAHLHDLRRLLVDGLGGPGRHRRQAGQPVQAGRMRRRRRRLPR